MGQHSLSDFLRHLLVRFLRWRTRAQRLYHPRPHFPSGFFGERDGDHRVRRIHRLQQAKVALDEQLGFSRAGRRLDDERCARIQSALARSAVIQHR